MPIACCYSPPSTPSADRTAVASCSLPTCAASPVPFLLSTQLGAQRCCTGDLLVFSLVSTSCHRRRQNSGSLSLSLTLGCGARVRVLGFMGSGEQRKLGREMEEEMRGLGEEPSKMKPPSYFFPLFCYAIIIIIIISIICYYVLF